jgi:hypothetical protein
MDTLTPALVYRHAGELMFSHPLRANLSRYVGHLQLRVGWSVF